MSEFLNSILSFIKGNCLGIISLGVAICTFCTTKRIAFVQQWDSLVSEYRSHEFGSAIKAICDFYIDDCERDFKKIVKRFELRYEHEMTCVASKEMALSDTLHFKRRLVSQYYWQLYVCINDNKRFAKKHIPKYFNKNEVSVMSIVHEMCRAGDNPKIFRSLIENAGDFREEFEIKTCIEKLHEKFLEIFKENTNKYLDLDGKECP